MMQSVLKYQPKEARKESGMTRVNEAVLKSAISLKLLEHQGEEVAVDALVNDLIRTGLIQAFVEELVWDLFTGKKGVQVCGEPLGTKVTMPEGFRPSEELTAAYRRVVEEASKRESEGLTTYFELATVSR